jgi:hypothetical protein
VDSRRKEFALGIPHDISERPFLVQRAARFRMFITGLAKRAGRVTFETAAKKESLFSIQGVPWIG